MKEAEVIEIEDGIIKVRNTFDSASERYYDVDVYLAPQADVKEVMNLVREQNKRQLMRMNFAVVYRDASDEARLYIAREEESRDAVGMLLLFFYKKKAVASIKQIISHRRKLGRALVELAISRARAARCELLTLEVRFENTNAQAFYEHFGFKRVGEKKWDFVYELRLDENPSS
jgi:GNAT superfamily N-acetyltransferase